MSAILFRFRGVLVVLAILPAALLPGRDAGVPQLLLVSVLLVLGVALRLSGVRRIGSRARVHTAGARELLTSGIFGHLRNPLYLGNALVAASLCVLLRSVESVLPVLILLLAAYTVIARHEEEGLRVLFGAAYEKYCAAVGRWIPRLRGYPERAIEKPVAWSAVIQSERLFLLGCALILTATGLLLIGVVPLERLRHAFLEAAPVHATAATLALACWLVIKIEAYRPAKRWLKQRGRRTTANVEHR